MRLKDRTVGLIHLSDEVEGKILIEKVRFLERVGVYIGEALHAFMAEEALQESERRYRDLYEEAPNAYFSVRVDGCIERANRRAAELLGYSSSELMGRPVFDLYADTPSGKARAQKVFQKFLVGEEVIGEELEMRRANGSKIWISLAVRPIRDKEGRVVLSRSTVVDITERKKLDQLKDEFIGLVSHELRSPLTVIIGVLHTVLSEGVRLSPAEMHQLLQDATWEAESLSHLLGNLLELSRVQSGRLLLHVEPINVKNVVQDTVDKVKQQYSAQQFHIDLPKGLPTVRADPLRLERILYNLLENAVKYSLRGRAIRVFAKLDNDCLVIGVSDQGVGISAQDQAKLFRSFQRLERPGIEGVKGAGLGLLVCRRLVETHGGRIWVESEPKRGATFFFTLPL
jgi:PAS domain S-box-containing protein